MYHNFWIFYFVLFISQFKEVLPLLVAMDANIVHQSIYDSTFDYLLTTENGEQSLQLVIIFMCVCW